MRDARLLFEGDILGVDGFGPVPTQDVPKFQRQRKREVNMQRAIAVLAGYASPVEAWRQNFACEHPIGRTSEVETDISDTFHFIFNEVQAYQEEMERKKKKKSFSEQMYSTTLLVSPGAEGFDLLGVEQPEDEILEEPEQHLAMHGRQRVSPDGGGERPRREAEGA